MYLIKFVIFSEVHLSLFVFKVNKIDIWQLIRKYEKARVNFKLHGVTNRITNKQTTAIHIPPDISRSRSNKKVV